MSYSPTTFKEDPALDEEDSLMDLSGLTALELPSADETCASLIW